MDKSDVKHLIRTAAESNTDKIDLSNKGITELPDEIGELTSLKSLNISYNNISEIPNSICKLVNLEELFLVRNNVSKLPANFSMLSKLKVLDVSNNPLVKLPKELGSCCELEILDSSFCELKSLPLELTNLLGLKSLNLEENPIEFPPHKVIKRGLYAIMHFLALEKKKNEASKVMLQVFNLPEKIQGPFREYIQFFNKMISTANNKEMLFEINFINQEFYKEMELNTEVESYLFDVMRYIQQKLEQVKNTHTDSNMKEAYFENRLSEIKEQLFKFNSSLDDKIDEIKHMKKDLNSLFNILDQ